MPEFVIGAFVFCVFISEIIAWRARINQRKRLEARHLAVALDATTIHHEEDDDHRG